MARTGRPRKPTPLKALDGGSHHAAPKDEPKPLPITPDCPNWLSDEGRAMWKSLIPELERLQLITIVDGGALAAACQSWALWVECEKFLTAKGRTYRYTNKKTGAAKMLPRPEVAMANQALSQYRAFITEFGLTPASRTRLTGSGGSKWRREGKGQGSGRRLTGVG